MADNFNPIALLQMLSLMQKKGNMSGIDNSVSNIAEQIPQVQGYRWGMNNHPMMKLASQHPGFGLISQLSPMFWGTKYGR